MLHSFNVLISSILMDVTAKQENRLRLLEEKTQYFQENQPFIPFILSSQQTFLPINLCLYITILFTGL